VLAALAPYAAAAGPEAGAESRPLHHFDAKPAPANESAPLRGNAPESHMGGSVFQTVAALGTVVGVILVLGVVVKRVARRGGGLLGALGPGGRAPSGVLEVLGRYPVGRGTTLVLLKMDRRILLLSQGGGGKLGGGAGMTMLSEITDPEEVASILLKTRDDEEATLAQRFQSMLKGEENSAAELLEPAAPSRSATAITGPDSFALTQARAKAKPAAAIRTRLDSLRTPARAAAGAKAS
jgi:flagellar biogenesis protein FliO